MTHINETATDSRLREGYAGAESLLRTNLTGVTQQHAAASGGEGLNDMLWVLGHVTYWRSEMTVMMGGARPWTDDRREVFRGINRAPAVPSTGWRLKELLQAYDTCSKAFYGSLESTPAGSEVLEGIAALLVHESYHVGQLGVMRRLVGLPGVT